MNNLKWQTFAIIAASAVICLLSPFSSVSADTATSGGSPAQPVHKPAPGSRINWSHPLARGLVTALPINEGSGSTFYDAVTDQTYSARVLSGTPSGAQPPTWINPPLSPSYPWIGPAISNNNATAQAIQSTKLATEIVDRSKVGIGYYYAVLFEPLASTTLGRVFDTTKNAPMVMYMLGGPCVSI